MTASTNVTAGRDNGRRRPRGYAAWRPQPKAQALLAQVDEVFAEYAHHLPLTVRQIFYRLVAVHGFKKTERAYERLGDVLVRARRARMVPFTAIRDDGVTVMRSEFFGGVEDFHDETARRARAYRRDRQAGQRAYVELWCEAGGMIEQLARVADDFSVPVYSSGGFSSLTATRHVAVRALRRDVPTVLLHVGDFDPSGASIFASSADDAAAFVEDDRTIMPQRIEAHRVALTARQVAEHDLQTAPPKRSDSRTARWEGETCQLEALAPDVLASIVQEAIKCRLDLTALGEQIERERKDRAELLALPPGEEPS